MNDITKFILFGLLKCFGFFCLFLLVYFIIATIKAYIAYMHSHTWSMFNIPKKPKIHKLIVEHRYKFKLVEFIKWCIVDTLRGKDRLRLWGLWAFTGYYGQGKTMGCVQFAKYLQKSYPHRDIKIYSNIEVDGQVKRITSWEELLDLPKNSIMIYDESQSDWSCNIGTNSFPEDFLRRITQCRKKQFAMFMTSPTFRRMNINIRESVNFVIECKNILDMDRWFKYDFYRAEEYEVLHENKFKLHQNKYLSMSFVTHDDDYKLYNTVEEVESIKDVDIKLNKKDSVVLGDEIKKLRNEIYKTIENEIKSVKMMLK